MVTIHAINDGMRSGLTAIISRNGNFPKVNILGCGYNLEGELRSSSFENPWQNYAKMWIEIELFGLSRNTLSVQVQTIVCQDMSALNAILHRTNPSEKSILDFTETRNESETTLELKVTPRVTSFQVTGQTRWILDI